MGQITVFLDAAFSLCSPIMPGDLSLLRTGAKKESPGQEIGTLKVFKT
jgi:hypothetical protein